jgi:hypothetical protein
VLNRDEAPKVGFVLLQVPLRVVCVLGSLLHHVHASLVMHKNPLCDQRRYDNERAEQSQ